jgi:hypothetical protein
MNMNQSKEQLEWYRVAAADELPEGRVKTVVAGTQSMAHMLAYRR